MDQGKSSNAILYFITLAVMILVPFSLDQFFGFHYEPEPLNQEFLKYHSPEETNTKHSGDLKQDDPEDIAHQAKVENKDTLEAEPEVVIEQPEIKAEESSDSFFTNLLTNYKSEIIADLPENKSRTDIVIRYYRHPPDGNSPYALEELGYYIHERPISEGLENYQSNAIFYGDSVRLEDIQIVAYTLLKEGLPIKVIRPSKFSNSWKSKSIEIGTDTTLFELPTLTEDEIKKLSF